MKCTHTKRLLPLFIGGDLSTQQADSVRAHLFACQHCNDLATDYSESAAWLSSAGRPDFDENFFEELRDSVFERVRAEQKTHARASGPRGWLLVFAAAAAIVVFAFLPALYRSRVEQLPVAVAPGANTRGQVPVAQSQSAVGSGERVRRRLDLRGEARPASRIAVARVLPVIVEGRAVTSESKLPLAEEVATVTTTMRRIEIQTADPSVRIIWIVREAPASVPAPVETDD